MLRSETHQLNDCSAMIRHPADCWKGADVSPRPAYALRSLFQPVAARLRFRRPSVTICVLPAPPLGHGDCAFLPPELRPLPPLLNGLQKFGMLLLPVEQRLGGNADPGRRSLRGQAT